MCTAIDFSMQSCTESLRSAPQLGREAELDALAAAVGPRSARLTDRVSMPRRLVLLRHARSREAAATAAEPALIRKIPAAGSRRGNGIGFLQGWVHFSFTKHSQTDMYKRVQLSLKLDSDALALRAARVVFVIRILRFTNALWPIRGRCSSTNFSPPFGD